MRIAISGAAGLGKSTLVKDICTAWDCFSTPEGSYRDILDKSPSTHSKNTCEDQQMKILDYMIEQQKQYTVDDNIVFDRCGLDNLIYSLWKHEKDGSISKEFIDKCIPKVKDSIKMLDIIFIIPYSKFNASIEDDGMRETDEDYIKEIDNFFQIIKDNWDDSPFTHKDDKAPIIEIFGNRQERIEMIKLYVDSDGDAIGEQGIMTPEEMEKIEQLLGTQMSLANEEKQLKKAIEMSRSKQVLDPKDFK